ncbi:MAG: CDP-diacylglycerol--glycerol-3-phosphate 3-phosphatidyltransferase [Spirochaetes bacterium]|nr:CDP-diacylglycerol--glycerol-3-phosphate 3-phosphatidyltransferase [Spirochaetota bacterium]MBU0956983.1 CDP-diacylglycerol--glycerol-3-phosphate 3-phosphatidyltransferase [Spirochaetota bacterium]
MTLANKVTASRIVLAPIFFILFSWGRSIGIPHIALAIILWTMLILMEISDMIDGMLARGTGSITSFGKLFDPFADVLSHLTSFVCFMLAGIMPSWVFLVILFREYSMLFLRLLLTEKGVTMAARKGGKLKSFMYAISVLASLLYWTLAGLAVSAGLLSNLLLVIQVLYIVCAVLALLSFVDYLIQFRKIQREA